MSGLFHIKRSELSGHSSLPGIDLWRGRRCDGGGGLLGCHTATFVVRFLAERWEPLVPFDSAHAEAPITGG